jgi:hypothetical protein
MAQSLAPTGLEVSGLHIIGHEKRIWGIEVVNTLSMDLFGIPGDRHSGQTRVVQPYESVELAGHKTANDKQVSIVGESDMQEIADQFDLPSDQIEERAEMTIAQFMAQQLAANVLVGGASLNEKADQGTLFVFGPNAQDVRSIVRLTEYNEPCKKPLIKLLDSLGRLGLKPDRDFDTMKERFKSVASTRRGWVASVHQTGHIAIGHSVFTHQPVDVPKSERF